MNVMDYIKYIKLKNGKRIPIYKETYTESQLKEIEDNHGVVIYEEDEL